MMRPEIPQGQQDLFALRVLHHLLGEFGESLGTRLDSGLISRLRRNIQEPAQKLENPRGPLPGGERRKSQKIVDRNRDRSPPCINLSCRDRVILIMSHSSLRHLVNFGLRPAPKATPPESTIDPAFTLGLAGSCRKTFDNRLPLQLLAHAGTGLALPYGKLACIHYGAESALYSFERID
jgi:hypothetical protein